jgi:hypothetical protein
MLGHYQDQVRTLPKLSQDVVDTLSRPSRDVAETQSGLHWDSVGTRQEPAKPPSRLRWNPDPIGLSLGPVEITLGLILRLARPS